MNSPVRRLFPLILLLLLPVSVTVAQQQVYTWTDENGVVHFDDRPPAEGEAQTIVATEAYKPGSVSNYGQPAEAGAAGGDSATAAQQIREDLEQQRQQNQQERAQLDAMCANYREQVERLEPHRRVYYQDESGETVRMDDVERVNMVQAAKDFIAANCQN